ncbi:MAG TPA: hypothetical protein VFZ38_05925, partial [Vicinamibacterales bacterium]
MIRRPILAITVLLAAAACNSQPRVVEAPAPPANPLPGTKLSVDELKAQMFHVSAGKRLKGAWPNGAKVAVGLSFDVDNA